MKTLYESILGSTQSGKDKIIREKIQKWIDSVSQDKNNHLFGYNCKNKFTINADLTVSYSGDLYLDVYTKDGRYEEITQIPEYINFNKIQGNFQIKLYTINTMKNSQFPKEIGGILYIKGDREVIKDLYIKAHDIVFANNSFFSKIENVKVELGDGGTINFNNSKITIEEFKNIEFVNDNLESIECSYTPMGDTILRTRNKFFKNEDMEGFKKYMTEIVPKTKFPHLLKIVIKPKRKLLDGSLNDWWVLTDQYGKWVTK
jgi:hypothetical protein